MSYTKVLLLLLFTSVLYAQTNTQKFRDLFNQKQYSQAVQLAAQASTESPKDQTLMIEIGDAYLELEKIDEALVFFKKADDIKDDQPPVMCRIGRVISMQALKLYQAGNQEESLKKIKEAEKILKNAIDEDKKRVESYIEISEHFIRNQNMKDAEIYLGRAKKIAPQDPRVEITQGDMYFEQGIYELAKNAYLNALSLDEKLLLARKRLATSLNWLGAREIDPDLKNGLYKESLDEWYNVAKADDKDSDAYFNIGKILFFSERYKDALQPLYKYNQLKPDGATGRWFLGQTFYELQLPDSALPHYEYSAKHLDSVKYKANVMIARVCFEAKKYPQSIAKYNEIFNSKDAAYDSVITFSDYSKLGQAYLNSNDTNKALDTYESLINKYPDQSCGLTYATARLALNGKRYERAINLLNMRLNNANCKTEGKDSLEAQVVYYMGTAYLLSGKYDEAIASYNKSYTLDNKQNNILINLAEAYLQKNDKETAKSNYRKFVDIAKKDSTISRNQLNQSFQKLCAFEAEAKNYKAFNEVAKEWAEAAPNLSMAHYFLGLSYQAIKEMKSCCEAFKKAVEVDPNNAKAAEMIQKLKCK